MKTRFLAVLALISAVAFTARGQTNSWIDGSSKWETATNWSLGAAPSSSDQADLITNAGVNTITIDATTTNTPSAMTISNLLVSANTLSILNVGTNIPLHILNVAALSSGASLLITNSALVIDGLIGPGAALEIGGTNMASMTVLAGSVVSVSPLSVGIGAMPGAGGTLTLAGGTLTVGNVLTFGSLATTATVWVTGGNLIAGSVYVGGGAFANADRLVLSNGTIRTADLIIGQGFNAVGTMTMAGGTAYVGHSLLLGATVNGGTGFLTLDGGSLFVTNPSIAVLTVDQGTLTLSNGATLVTDSLITTSPTASFINLGGTFLVTSPAQVEQGTMTVSGGTNQLGSTLTVAASAGSTGAVDITAGELVATNGASGGVIGVGNDGTTTNGFGVGSLTVSNGTMLANQVLLGSSAGGQGQLTVQTNGLVSLIGTGAVLVANDLTIDGGDVEILNGQIFCGKSHPGAMTMSNGTANSQITYVGYDSQGTLTMLAGQMTVSSLLDIGFSAGSTGSVWMSGGQLTATALPTIVGNSGVGQMSISNGIVTMADVFVGNGSNPGTLTLAGGTLTVFSSLSLGDCGGSMTGIVTMTGGTLYVTNAAHNAVLEVRSGQFLMTGGALVADRLVMTNGCGLFQRTGGSINIGSMTLDPNLSAAGDGIPNGWKQQYNLDPLDPYVGSKDADGTGQNNLFKFTAGLDPTNPASVFTLKIASVTGQPTQKNLLFNPEVSGRTYTPQFRTNMVSGAWATLAGIGGPVTNVNQVTVTDLTATQTQKFYRINISLP